MILLETFMTFILAVQEFATPGTYEQLRCGGRACSVCKECRDWDFNGSQEDWRWIQDVKNWKDADWQRYSNGEYWNYFKPHSGATCTPYRGGSDDANHNDHFGFL
ncbi:unnamed protein product, partial [Rotaria magnacalcarata]